MADFTNVWCRASGNNLNAGTVDGSTTEPATTPLVTYTGGDWEDGTNVFTAAVGADMTEAQVGRFASVYADGDTVPTTNQFTIGRITAVNAGARTVTLAVQVNKGTEIADGTGNRSMRIGGAWLGPQGTALWPFDGTNLAGLATAASDTPAVHLKNDQTYSVTAAMTVSGTSVQVWGYTTAAFDGGIATIDGGATGAAYNVLRFLSNFQELHDAVVQNNGATGGNTTRLIGFEAGGQHCENVTASGSRGYGMYTTGNANRFVKCETFDCNQSDTVNHGGFAVAGGTAVYRRCVASHNDAGSNGIGFMMGGTSAILQNCIAHKNGSHGVLMGSTSGVYVFDTDLYDNAGAGANATGANNYLENCNLVGNGTYGIGGTSTVLLVHTRNCGYGSGTQANASGNTQTPAQIIDSGSFSYSADITPWNDPENGDFSITHEEAIGTGDGSFRQTEAGQAGTVGFPDVGAAPSSQGISTGTGTAATGGGIRLVGHGGLVA